MLAKKVGVLTFHKCVNYGSYWQARCLVEGLRARGFHAELLDHDCACVRRAEVKCALQPKLPDRTPRTDLPNYARKVRRFVRSIARLPQSARFSLHRPQDAPGYDAIVVGSDEVWNFRHPWYGSKPIFFGDGLKADRLVSYAASFGNHSALDGIHPDWARKLHNFAAISVRDENSLHLASSATGREVELTLDPCLLFAPAIESGRGDYAVVYGHGFPKWLAGMARRWTGRSRVRLISVGYSNDWADEQLIDAGPMEFARLMAGADAVITNFFHGCVFALLNGKPWVTVPSDYRSIKIPDLAAMLGVGDRVIGEQTTEAELNELLASPAGAAQRLEEHRARSEAYIDAALS
jgi:hypothetical protein